MNKMIPHMVTEEELADFEAGHWVRLAGSFGKNSHKSLDISLERVYRVLEHSVMIYIGGSRKIAVATYNRLP